MQKKLLNDQRSPTGTPQNPSNADTPNQVLSHSIQSIKFLSQFGNIHLCPLFSSNTFLKPRAVVVTFSDGPDMKLEEGFLVSY